MTDEDRRVAIGKLGRPHGIRGEIRLFLFNSESKTVTEGLQGFITREGHPPVEVTVEKARYTDRFVILKLEDIDDRGEIDEYKHGHLEVDYDDLPDLTDDEFYYVELVGASVYEAEQEDGAPAEDTEPLGTVDRFFETGANDVMVVDLSDDDELFVPLVEHAVALLDFKDHQVVLQPLELWTAADYDEES